MKMTSRLEVTAHQPLRPALDPTRKNSSPLGREVVLIIQVHLHEIDYPAAVRHQDREADVDEL